MNAMTTHVIGSILSVLNSIESIPAVTLHLHGAWVWNSCSTRTFQARISSYLQLHPRGSALWLLSKWSIS